MARLNLILYIFYACFVEINYKLRITDIKEAL